METNSNQNQTFFKIALGVTVGIIALLSYLFIGAKNETAQLQNALNTKVEQLSDTQIKLDSIAKSLDQKIAETEALGGDVAELKKVKAQLESDKKKLKTDLNTSIEQYEAKIKEYEEFLAVKDEELNKLKEENGILTERTKTLQSEKEAALAENTGLKNEKASLTKTVQDVSSQNEELKRKVTMASAMKAINVAVYAVASNGKVREGGVYKVSKIDRLKIAFTLASNPVAEKNNKDIYVRILDATGAVVSESGSGVITIDGKEIGYTTKQGVLFDNSDQKVEVLYAKGSPYKAGKYSIEMYSEGFKIGAGAFEVK